MRPQLQFSWGRNLKILLSKQTVVLSKGWQPITHRQDLAHGTGVLAMFSNVGALSVPGCGWETGTLSMPGCSWQRREAVVLGVEQYLRPNTSSSWIWVSDIQSPCQKTLPTSGLEDASCSSRWTGMLTPITLHDFGGWECKSHSIIPHSWWVFLLFIFSKGTWALLERYFRIMFKGTERGFPETNGSNAKATVHLINRTFTVWCSDTNLSFKLCARLVQKQVPGPLNWIPGVSVQCESADDCHSSLYHWCHLLIQWKRFFFFLFSYARGQGCCSVGLQTKDCT